MASSRISVARIAVGTLRATTTLPSATGRHRPGQPQGRERSLACACGRNFGPVEVFPQSHIALLAEKLALKGLDYKITFLPQPLSHLGIGFLHKPGIDVTNPRFIAGSEGAYTGGRQAFVVDVKIGQRFKAVVIGVHLKSGRDAPDQALRDTQCKASATDHHVARTPAKAARHPVDGGFQHDPRQDVSTSSTLRRGRDGFRVVLGLAGAVLAYP